jgi:hypothetical protein
MLVVSPVDSDAPQAHDHFQLMTFHCPVEATESQ